MRRIHAENLLYIRQAIVGNFTYKTIALPTFFHEVRRDRNSRSCANRFFFSEKKGAVENFYSGL